MSTPDEIYNAITEKMFTSMDKNGDNKVTKDEILKALATCDHKHCEEDAEKFFQELDTDKNGCLTKDELLEFVKKVVTIVSE